MVAPCAERAAAEGGESLGVGDVLAACRVKSPVPVSAGKFEEEAPAASRVLMRNVVTNELETNGADLCYINCNN